MTAVAGYELKRMDSDFLAEGCDRLIAPRDQSVRLLEAEIHDIRGQRLAVALAYHDAAVSSHSESV